MGGRRMRHRSAWVLILAPVLSLASLGMATAGQAAVQGPARPAASQAKVAAHPAKIVRPNRVNQLDCNGYSAKYQSLDPEGRGRCTDPVRRHAKKVNGKWVSARFEDNGHYIGHDEPSVKFISHARASGNTMTYVLKLPTDPKKAPTATGSVTKYAQLSIAPWFGLPMCDPNSYPQNPCKPHSDSNTGLGASTDAGSAFMELQFYAPGFAPFQDNVSCDRTQWCSALNIDSLSATFNFAFINPNCTEPVNFAYLQRNGVPAGPPSPQLADASTQTPNGQTLKMNSGDVLVVSITDPLRGPNAGFTTRIDDLTTHQTGFMIASAKNGFMNTNFKTCNGTPHTFHAEYATAAQQNQVPWAALEGGVLMQQEIGHSESCNSVSSQLPLSAFGGGFTDNNVFQVCNGGSEGKKAVGEGPCDPNTGVCQNATTEGKTGPVACPSNNAGSGLNCEFSDGACFKKGNRTVTINGVASKVNSPVAFCANNLFQNGDLDFDGTDYQPQSWPDGTGNHPTSFRYIGPFTRAGNLYRQIQFETNVGASEILCNTSTGAGCAVKPQGSAFYPFWSLNNTQRIDGSPRGACVWNFGNVLPGVTKRTFGQDAQYGVPNVARFAGTSTSPVIANPATRGNCAKVRI
jgi:hypothetical protein